MIYIHVPFCGSFCTYCDFYSEIRRDLRAFNEYADAVIEEISDRWKELSMNMSAPSAVSTLYIGGGTPSVLPLSVLRRIVLALRPVGEPVEPVGEPVEPVGEPVEPQRPWCDASTSSATAVSPAVVRQFHQPAGRVPASDLVPVTELVPVAEPVPVVGPVPVAELVEAPEIGTFSEFTMEVNPEDIIEKGSEYVSGLIALGVNRISMGVQSFNDGILRWMNRRHNAAGASEAFRILWECGVRNISIDLIFGLSQLSDDVWEDTIEKALELSPEHISAYQLSIEDGSALARMAADGRYAEASDEQCRHQYDILCHRLGQAGYRHYEISNFAKPGFEAVHNSAYWRRVPYVGLGPGAHSLNGDVRSWNTQTLPHRNPDGSLATYSRGSENLSEEDIRVERIMLPLRTDVGLEAEELYSLADRQALDTLLDEGALVRVGDQIRIPEDHFFTSDEIIRELI